MTVALSGTRLIGSFTTTSPATISFSSGGSPRGIVVAITHGVESTDLISGVTYGGVAMTRIDFAQDTATEPGAAYLYFLGASVPTFVQDVVFTHTGSATTKIVWIRALSAAADTEVAVSGVLEEDQANPQIALDSGADSSLRVSALYTGLGGVASLTVLAGMEAFDSAGADANFNDQGAFCLTLGEQTTASTGSFTIGYTAASDDVAMVAAAIREVSAATAGPSRMMTMGVG